MWLFDIVAKYIGRLKAAITNIEDGRYDMIECGATGRNELVYSLLLTTSIMGVQKWLMRILTTIDTIWLNEVQLASPNWSSQISCEAVAYY